MVIDFSNVMKNKTDYLTLKEIDTMLQYCYDKEKLRDYMLILTLSRTGRRVTEIVGRKPYTKNVGLRPCDIHPEGLIEFDILKKNHVKDLDKEGKKRHKDTLARLRYNKAPLRRLFPVDDFYLECLKNYIQRAGIKPFKRVFPITRQRVDLIIKEVAKKCSIVRPSKKIHAHNFRHSYAINLLKDNPNDASILKQLQELLAHSNINITMHYAQFTPEDKKTSLNKLFNQ